MAFTSGNGAQPNLFYLDLTNYSGGNASLSFSWNYAAGGDLGVGWVSVNGNLQVGQSIVLHTTGVPGGSTSVALVTTVNGTFNFNGNNGSAPRSPILVDQDST